MTSFRVLLILVLLAGCAEVRKFWDKEFVEVYTPGASREQKARETAGVLNYWLGQTKDERIRVMGPADKCTALPTGEEVCEWTTRGASSGQRVTFAYEQGVATAWAYSGGLGQFTSADYQTLKAGPLPASQGSSSTNWVHPTKPQSEFTREYTECEKNIVKDPKAVYANKFVLQDLTFTCMKQNGWRPNR